MRWSLAPTDEFVGVSCICLVFVCFGDERFRWTVCQGCVGTDLRNTPTRHESDYERTRGWNSSALLRIGSSILTLVSG